MLAARSVLVALLSLRGAAAAQPPLDSPQEPYLALARRYRGGDLDGAVEEVRTWLRERLKEELQRLKGWKQVADRCSHCPEAEQLSRFPLEAAVMLHTDAAFESTESYASDERDFHRHMARGLVDLLGDRPGGPSFARRWLLAMGLHFQSELNVPSAMPYLRDALRLSPQDPEVLVAIGSLHEMMGSLGMALTKRVRVPTRPRDLEDRLASASEARSRILAAERHYRQALEADPSREEAHLRLGRVLAQRGRAEEALTELEWVLGSGRDRGLIYLAHLFRGRVHEDAGRLEAAVASYRDAARIEPRCQTAHVALSHILHRSGDRAAALRALEHLLRRDDASGDRWWTYHFGRRERFQALLEELREEAVS